MIRHQRKDPQYSRLIPLLIFVCILSTVSVGRTSPAVGQQRHVILVVGASGEATYETEFSKWAERWIQATKAAGNSLKVIGLPAATDSTNTPSQENAEQNLTDYQKLQAAIQEWKTKQESQENQAETRASKNDQLWLVLIGHGTFDKDVAKFNLVGPDVSAKELSDWLPTASQDRSNKVSQIVINCSSASGPFVNRLSAPHRIVVSATASGMQFNFARFGDYLSKQIAANEVDLDKDEQTSLLEAVLAAANDTNRFYETEKRLATETAVIEDNGDGLATPAEWFEGSRATKEAKDHQADGLRSNQVFFFPPTNEDQLSEEARIERDQLEATLDDLRRMKLQLPEAVYMERLEQIAVEIARLYHGKEGKD